MSQGEKLICGNCGAEWVIGFNYCRNCKVSAAQAFGKPQSQPPMDQQPAQTPQQLQPLLIPDKQWEIAELSYYQTIAEAQLVICGVSDAQAIDIKRDKNMGDKNALSAVYRMITQLNFEGWELVSVTEIVTAREWNRKFYFKRLVQH